MKKKKFITTFFQSHFKSQNHDFALPHQQKYAHLFPDSPPLVVGVLGALHAPGAHFPGVFAHHTAHAGEHRPLLRLRTAAYDTPRHPHPRCHHIGAC